MSNEIHDKVNEQRETLAEQYREHILRSWARMIETDPTRRFDRGYQGTALKRGRHHLGLDHFRYVMQPVLKTEDGGSDSFHTPRPKVLDEERVEKEAQRHADTIIETLVVKIDNKVGMLDNVEHFDIRGGDFNLVGHIREDRVAINQRQILNVSSRGRLFNQWPARIKVNGKAMSAKKFSEVYGIGA